MAKNTRGSNPLELSSLTKKNPQRSFTEAETLRLLFTTNDYQHLTTLKVLSNTFTKRPIFYFLTSLIGSASNDGDPISTWPYTSSYTKKGKLLTPCIPRSLCWKEFLRGTYSDRSSRMLNYQLKYNLTKTSYIITLLKQSLSWVWFVKMTNSTWRV